MGEVPPRWATFSANKAFLTNLVIPCLNEKLLDHETWFLAYFLNIDLGINKFAPCFGPLIFSGYEHLRGMGADLHPLGEKGLNEALTCFPI